MADQNTQVPPQAPVPPPVSTGVDNDKLMGILSYLSILVLIPLLVTKNRSAFLNFHVNQGLSLLILQIIGMVVFRLVFVLFFLWPIWNILILILVIMGIVNVTKNEMKAMPVIGNWFHFVK